MATRKTVPQEVEALQALAVDSGPRIEPAVARALKHRSPLVREWGIRIAKEHSLANLIPAIEVCLDDRARWCFVRTEAAVCLGELLQGTGQPHPGLRKLLSDPDWVVRIDALEALTLIGDEGAAPQIVALLDDEHGTVRGHCASALVAGWGNRFVPHLRQRLTHEEEPHARLGILASLYTAGQRNHLPEILSFLQHADYTVRCLAVHCLADLRLREPRRTLVIDALKALSLAEPTRAVTSTIEDALTVLAPRT